MPKTPPSPREDHRFTIPSGNLLLKSDDGEIIVMPSTDGLATLTATTPSIMHGKLETSVVLPVADCVLRVPLGVKVSAASSSGRLIFVDLQGEIRAKTASGDIIAKNIDAAVLTTESGEITVSGATGMVHAASESGNISAVDIENAAITSSSGRIAASLSDRGRPTRLNVGCESGDALIDFPHDSGTSVTARTEFGNIMSNVESQRGLDDAGRYLTRSVSDPHSTVSVTSESGSLIIRSRDSHLVPN